MHGPRSEAKIAKERERFGALLGWQNGKIVDHATGRWRCEWNGMVE